MKGFFQLISSAEFLDLYENFQVLEQELIPLAKCLGRMLAKDIIAPEALPPFARSTMDGFAVQAKDTFGCSESEPAILKITGEVVMGESAQDTSLARGQSCTIWTGGELPAKADAVIMVEYTSRLDNETIEIFRPVAPGENVIQPGEDYQKESLVLKAGKQLRPQDLGVVAGLGMKELPVIRQPNVAIISTGDELIDIDQPLAPGKIRDINSTTLATLVQDCGGKAFPLGIIGDDKISMKKACEKALSLPADMILLSGGSSVGRRDFTMQVLEELNNTEILAHGVSIKPGKPTILARKENVALFGLPGHVGSAIVVFHVLVRPLLRKFLGLSGIGLQRIEAITTQQIPSTIGREDYVRVSLSTDETTAPPSVTPVYGKSGLLKPLIRADGLLVIDRDTEGLDKGAQGEVLLFP